MTDARSRARALEAHFREVASTRMAGLPVLHPGLRVEAIGFEADADGRCAVGVLVTPWFMNLVRLPLPGPHGEGSTAPARGVLPSPASADMAPAGHRRTRAVGNEQFDFVGAEQAGLGPYEVCSLFSPMFQFTDHAAAAATARAVLDQLRRPARPPPARPAAPRSRRALLLGRAALEPRR